MIRDRIIGADVSLSSYALTPLFTMIFIYYDLSFFDMLTQQATRCLLIFTLYLSVHCFPGT